jgi:hypothetical protein
MSIFYKPQSDFSILRRAFECFPSLNFLEGRLKLKSKTLHHRFSDYIHQQPPSQTNKCNNTTDDANNRQDSANTMKSSSLIKYSGIQLNFRHLKSETVKLFEFLNDHRGKFFEFPIHNNLISRISEVGHSG